MHATIGMGSGANTVNRSELVSVQYLRGLAAALVVFYHARDMLPVAETLIPTEIGLAGVDLFFVISGLVMTYTAAIHRYGAGEFLARRIARVAPLYWVMTTLVAALLLLAPGIFQNSRFTFDSYVQSLFFIPHQNPGMGYGVFPMLKLGWTLNYEALFYVCFAALIALTPLLRTVVLTLGFAALVAAVAFTDPQSIPLRFWGDSIIFEFILGCAIGVLLLHGGLRTMPKVAAFALLLAGVVSLAVMSLEEPSALPRFLVWGIPCAMIVAACVALEQSTPAQRRNRLLHFLGDASYAVYLIHAYVVVGCRLAWEAFGLPTETPAAVLAFVVVAFVTAIAVGCIGHIVLEKPLTEAARRLVQRRAPARA